MGRHLIIFVLEFLLRTQASLQRLRPSRPTSLERRR